MKRKIGILLCLALLTLCAIALADITLETDQYFKDATFREQVRINFDENYDKQLSDDEIAKATFIVVSDMDITSLKGIEYLVSLETLGCHGNKLTSVDLSANKELKFLELWDNQLGTLDVTQNTKLTHLSCEGNQLKTLDLSKNTVLSELYCNGNQITTLDVSNCPSLCSAMENNERIVTTDDHHRFGNYFHIDKDVTVIGRNGKISKPENGELPVVEGSIKWSDLHYSFANTAKDGSSLEPVGSD